MDKGEFVVKNIAEVGNFIKDQRKAMDVTQDELANFASLSRIGVVKLEKEKGDIKLSTLLKVANLLGFELVLKKRANR